MQFTQVRPQPSSFRGKQQLAFSWWEPRATWLFPLWNKHWYIADWTRSGVFHPYLPYGCPLQPHQMALDGKAPFSRGKMPWGWQAILMQTSGQDHCMQPLRSQWWVVCLFVSPLRPRPTPFWVKLQADGSRLGISFSAKAQLKLCRKYREKKKKRAIPSKCPPKLCSWKVF